MSQTATIFSRPPRMSSSTIRFGFRASLSSNSTWRGRVFVTGETRQQALTDRQDLGFCLLNERAVAALTAGGLDFLSYRQTSFEQVLPPSTRLICSGYPVTKSRDHVRGHITNTRMDIDERALTSDELVTLGYDPRNHVALHYDRLKVQHKRQAITGALPRGMSGGPIWQVADGVQILLAILTDYDAKKKVLRGTRINPLLFEIRRRILASLDPAAGGAKP